MKKLSIVWFVLVLIFAMLLVSCGGAATTTTAAATTKAATTQSATTTSAATTAATTAKKLHFVHITKNLTNPTFVMIADGVKQFCNEKGITVDVLAPLTANSSEEQINLLLDCITKKVDAVILIPLDGAAIVSAVQQLSQANIPIINVNTKIGAGTYTNVKSFVSADNVTAAFTVTTELCKQLGGKGDAIMLTGTAGASSAVELEQGARDALKNYPDIKVVATQTAKYDRATAFTTTQNLLQANPNVNAIIASNDEMALGAIEALKAAKYTPGQVLVCGVDGNADARQAIKDGWLQVTADKANVKQGYSGASLAYDFLMGKSLKDVELIPPVLITKANVN